MYKRKLITGSAHLLFWVISFLLLFRLFTKDYNNGAVDVVYTFLFHLPLILVVYLNQFFIKKCLLKGGLITYVLSFLFLIFLGLGTHILVFEYLSKLLIKDYYFVSLFSTAEIILYLLAYLIFSLLIQLSLSWYKLKERQAKMEQKSKEIQLSALKSQLNPHFLFNSMNNIYSLISSADQTSRAYLIKLSDALRYMLYRTQEEEVSLVEEIEYLSNYIELEKLRLEDDTELNVTIHGKAENLKIAPLLLLPLVENIFKHTEKTNARIEITFHIENGTLRFESQNAPVVSDNKNQDGGIGLSNIKKRLELLYANNYTFESYQSEGQYITKLLLKLNP